MDILEIPFVGAYELRRDLPIILARLQKKGEEVVITQKGKPAAMLLPVKKYLEMGVLAEELEDALRELKDKEYLVELIKAEKEIRAGKGKAARKIFKELRV